MSPENIPPPTLDLPIFPSSFPGMPARSKHYLRLKKTFLARITAAALIFSFSILILPFCIAGDQTDYRTAYDSLRDLNIKEGFLFYSLKLDSLEFVHFLLSWLASRVVSKDLFIAFSNALLAYIAMSLFQKRNTSIIIAFLIILTNYYFFAVYFTAERLKFGFIFLFLSMIYFDRVKRFYGFAVLALVSHVQVAIVFASLVFNYLVKQLLKLFRTAKISKAVLLVPLVFIPLFLVKAQILAKFQFYYKDKRALVELVRILLFFMLALWYSKKKKETLVIFIPIFFAVFLVGGDRVNIFGYFVFLFYGLQIRRGWNFGVLATSLYFTYSSIVFLVNIFKLGDGFPQ